MAVMQFNALVHVSKWSRNINKRQSWMKNEKKEYALHYRIERMEEISSVGTTATNLALLTFK